MEGRVVRGGRSVVPDMYTRAATKKYGPKDIKRVVNVVDNVTITVIIYGKLIGIRQFKVKLKAYLKELIPMLHALTSMRRKHITIEFYPLGNRKLMPSRSGAPINAEHVNSGFCYIHSRDEDVNIVIYRREEFFKVMTHELVHLYDLILDDPVITQMFRQKYTTLSDIDANEAQTELMAVVLNSLVIHRLSVDNTSIEDLLRRELHRCSVVTNLLVSHFGLEGKTHDPSEIEMRWHESTHSFAYYMLRCALFSLLCHEFSIMNTPNTKGCVYTPQINVNSLRMTINDIENIKLT